MPLPFLNFDLQVFILRLPAIILALTFHEFFHGFAAYRLGDRTAKRDGRLSLNPLRHIDPIGIIMLLVIGFGWAKPVMVNPYNLKNPKQDMAIIALAGPLSNFLLAFIVAMIHAVFFHTIGTDSAITANISMFLGIFASINVVLGVFNMLPIPPLDGSKLFGIILPDRLYFRYINFPYGIIILLMILYAGTALTDIIGTFVGTILDTFYYTAEWIFFLFR